MNLTRRNKGVGVRLRYYAEEALAGLVLLGIALGGILLLLFVTPPGWIILTLVTLRIMGVI